YLNRIYFKNDKIEEEVGNMTKTLYDPEVERRGEIKGEIRGEIRGEIKGENRGIKLAKKVFRLSESGESVEQIAKECGISVDKVNEILE
ncbi:MAG: hypothetical protein ACRC30_16675, partial [Clostridium sp.]